MNKTLHQSVDIPYISKFFHPTENLRYPYRISTQRVVKLYLKFENERLNLDHSKERDRHFPVRFPASLGMVSQHPSLGSPTHTYTLSVSGVILGYQLEALTLRIIPISQNALRFLKRKILQVGKKQDPRKEVLHRKK